MLKDLIQNDPNKRMTWSQFFDNSVVKNEPAFYQ